MLRLRLNHVKEEMKVKDIREYWLYGKKPVDRIVIRRCWRNGALLKETSVYR